MSDDSARDPESLLRRAAKRYLQPIDENARALLDREAVKAALPFRHPFLFVDRVTLLDFNGLHITASFDLARAEPILAGHFPGRPILPGVLQIEAVGQAGALLLAQRGRLDQGESDDVALTHVLGARFVRPVAPPGRLWINARVVEQPLLTMVVGQCISQGAVASAAVLQGLRLG